MWVHNPCKAQKGGGGGEPRWCNKIGEHGRRKGGGEGVLVVRKRGERHSIFQSVMEIFGLVVSNLLEYSHHEFKLVFGHNDRGREVGFLPFGLGATLGMARP